MGAQIREVKDLIVLRLYFDTVKQRCAADATVVVVVVVTVSRSRVYSIYLSLWWWTQTFYDLIKTGST